LEKDIIVKNQSKKNRRKRIGGRVTLLVGVMLVGTLIGVMLVGTLVGVTSTTTILVILSTRIKYLIPK
jgi:hypothetical protein